MILCEGTLKKQHFGLMVSYYGGYIVVLSWMHKTQCVPLEEAGGLWVSDILLSHHWRSWSRRTSQECSWKETFLGSWYHLASLAWTSLLVLSISTHHSIVPPLTITHLWARGTMSFSPVAMFLEKWHDEWKKHKFANTDWVFESIVRNLADQIVPFWRLNLWN